MIEPPGQPIGAGIFEIKNGVFIAIKQAFIEELSGAMHQTLVDELRLRVHTGLVYACKQRRGAGSIKALIVKTNTYTHNGGRSGQTCCRLFGGVQGATEQEQLR